MPTMLLIRGQRDLSLAAEQANALLESRRRHGLAADNDEVLAIRFRREWEQRRLTFGNPFHREESGRFADLSTLALSTQVLSTQVLSTQVTLMRNRIYGFNSTKCAASFCPHRPKRGVRKWPHDDEQA